MKNTFFYALICADLHWLRDCHEGSREHRIALAEKESKPADAVELGSPCKGLCLTSGPGSQTMLGKIAPSVLDWFHQGCPGVVNSLFDEFALDSWAARKGSMQQFVGE